MHNKHPHLVHPKYRPDIDGLRAIAILSVVIFHAFPAIIPGGFIGVDIFFVISGFLISTITFSSLERGRFSLIEFYVRRIRRIFPALILVLVATIILGWFFFFPDEYKQLGKHTAAGAGFIQNFILWYESGYFDNASETKPLLHLWSLAIEEQFYIFWPLLLSYVWIKHWSFLKVTAVIAVISFAANLYLMHLSPTAGFFLPISRFWELMIGGMLAYTLLHYPKLLEKHKNGQAILGFFLIIAGLLLINKERDFPGWWTLIPTLGAFLIISAGADAYLNKNILANKLMIWIGLISYPLYLWHWPLLTYLRIIKPNVSSYQVVCVLLLAFSLAWATYFFVEKPIKLTKASKNLSGYLLGALAILVALGVSMYKIDSLSPRNTDQDKYVFHYGTHWNGWSECNFVPKNPGLGGCKILKKGEPIDIAVIGDSHAGHLASGLRNYSLSKKENVAILLHAGCYPFLPTNTEHGEYFKCKDNLIEKAFEFSIHNPSVKLIILSGYPALQIQKYRFHEANKISKLELTYNIDAFEKGLNNTFQLLQQSGKQVIFLLDNPELLKDPLYCKTRNIPLLYNECSINLPKRAWSVRNAVFVEILKKYQHKYPNIHYVSASDILCDDTYCYGVKDGNLLYASRDHLSPYGSNYLINAISPDIDMALKIN